MDNNTRRKLFAVLVAVASIALLQIHGVEFWMGQAGNTGIVWSLALEVAAIYLWLHGRTLPAVLASALLIAGPLYQVSLPLMEQAQGEEIAAATMVETEREIAQLENSLAKYEENSGKRLGWSGRIDRTQERLDTARERLHELALRQADLTGGWQRISIVVMESAALLVVLYSQIFALSQIQLVPGRGELASETTITPVSEPTVTAETLRKHMQNNGVSQREAAMQMGVRPADVSMLLNHAERLETGRETISKPALQKIEKGLISKWLYIPQSS